MSDDEEKIELGNKAYYTTKKRNSEKEWVRLCYKESIPKGLTVVNDIQCYVASKTKIWIERTGIEFLKKSEDEEDKKWYFNLPRTTLLMLVSTERQ